MKKLLRMGWPIVAAAFILYSAWEDLQRKIPGSLAPQQNRTQNSGTYDSLLYRIAQVRMPLSGDRVDTATANPIRNPFRYPNATGTTSIRSSRPPQPPPPRGYVLHGTVGQHVATISDNAGVKRIVSVGDKLDSAVVEAIEGETVILRDRAGRFELGRENPLR